MKNNSRFIIASTAPIRWLIIQILILYLFGGHQTLLDLKVFIIVISFGAFANMFWLIAVVPELSIYRASVAQGTKSWDKILLSLYFVNNLIVGPMAIAFDVSRLHFIVLSQTIEMAAIVVYFTALILILWSMKFNAFFEGTARIQTDRNQEVVTNGPYRIIRHPGYLGMILGALAVPLIARSMLGLFASLASAVIIVIRTYLEDEMLKRELSGYSHYAQRTRYRLIPGLW